MEVAFGDWANNEEAAKRRAALRSTVGRLPEQKCFIGDLLAIAYDRIGGGLDS